MDTQVAKTSRMQKANTQGSRGVNPKYLLLSLLIASRWIVYGFTDVALTAVLRKSGVSLTQISLMLGVGFLRILGLIINGARKKVTPQIRQVSAAIGCIIWAGITFGFYSSDVVSTWLAIYPLFAIAELVNIHRAAHDEGEIRNGTADR